MKSSTFDDLTKALATSTSRRQALKAIAATIGGVLGLGSIGTAFANCKPNGIGCNTSSQCCSGGCCHGTCTDLNTPQNCGSCGHTCDASQCQTCQHGACVSTCTSDQYCNNGTCHTYLGCSEPCSASLGLLCAPGLSCCIIPGIINPPDAGLCCPKEDCNTVAASGFCPAPGC